MYFTIINVSAMYKNTPGSRLWNSGTSSLVFIAFASWLILPTEIFLYEILLRALLSRKRNKTFYQLSLLLSIVGSIEPKIFFLYSRKSST